MEIFMIIRDALKEAILKLTETGVENAALDASLLLCHVLNIGRTELYIRDDEEIESVEYQNFSSLLDRRSLGEPMAYILGKKEFWGLEFETPKGVLIPRPDTETLIATVMAHIPDKETKLRFADIGVGSGAIILTLLHEYPHFLGEGVDISDTALLTTQKNSENLGLDGRLTLHKGEYLNPLSGTFELIVSNPPYIETSTVSTLSVDVKGFEPMEALDGGEDGLICYRMIIPQACDKLVSGGLLILEIGYNQAATVSDLFGDSWQGVQVIQDLAGHDRVIIAQKK